MRKWSGVPSGELSDTRRLGSADARNAVKTPGETARGAGYPPNEVSRRRRSLEGREAGAREVFAQAVQWQAAAIVVAHNHPSGDPTPSRSDVELTKGLEAASKVLRIPLLDHLVIGSPQSADGVGFVSICKSSS